MAANIDPSKSEVMGPSFEGNSVEKDDGEDKPKVGSPTADEDLQISTAAYKGGVLLQFSIPIKHVLFSPEQARDLSKALRVRSVEAIRQSSSPSSK